MGERLFHKTRLQIFILPAILAFLVSACHPTRYVPEHKYLLWKNEVVLRSDKVMTNRGEIKDNLANIIVQKPNSTSALLSILPFRIPAKLSKYNRRTKRLGYRPDSLLQKNEERPVIFDSLALNRSAFNLQNYMFNQGYFYVKVSDTVIYKKRKAYVTYYVNAGSNYIINRVNYDIDDSSILAIVRAHIPGSAIQKGKEFTYSQLESERSRLATIIANHGYRRFSLDNITFKIDTLDKSVFRVAASPFENAVNFLAQAKSRKKNTLDIDVIIRKGEDERSYNQYTIGSVTVYPDYMGSADRADSSMITKKLGGITFRYHENYVNPSVLYHHMFVGPGGLYSKANEDKTNSRLSELGVFRSVRIDYRENQDTHDSLDCNILMSRGQKHDFNVKYEVSNGTTYALGNSVSLAYLNRNFSHGANLLSISLNGGLETYYNDALSENIYRRFQILTWYYGANAGIDFPKFLAPFAHNLFQNSNLPHTLLNGGANVIERINYFRLVNISSNFTYTWHETPEKTWGLSPAFVNIIRLPMVTDSFRKVLSVNQYLANSYRENFIEGENISFRYDDNAKKNGKNYSYLKLSLEEAGGLLSSLNKVSDALNSAYSIQFAQYTKLDFDARHYFTFRRSLMAFRLYGGVGNPYGASTTLPYIKQYFVGGPYSLRGWRIRTLGPGSYEDTTGGTSLKLIDRTGDIKIEMNGEYRFPVAPLFAGAMQMNGALFADAGNIWLARKAAGYPGGDLAIDKLGQDIAMDIGLGARFDIVSFLTLRVDVAMPVKKPYIKANSGWVFDEINFGNPTWRSQNLILNISVGYPF